MLFGRLRLGRLAIPIWVLAAVLAAAAAGQAVGPVLVGTLAGDTSLVVEQALAFTDGTWREYPPTKLYSISPRDDELRVIDTQDVPQTISSVTITLPAQTVEGGNGLAMHPSTGVVYGLLKLQGQLGRELVTINPNTGVATSVGNTGDLFAGLAFDNAGTLYGVTGDGAGVPERLYTLSTVNASKVLKGQLGHGNDGETIAFNPDDGFLYHQSGEGVPNVNEIYELINPAALPAVVVPATQITLTGQDYAESGALTWEGTENFIMADLGRRMFRISTAGVVSFMGVIDHDSKGLVPFDLAIVPDSILVFNDEGTHFTAAAETHQGRAMMLELRVDNKSGHDLAAELTFNPPVGIDTQLTSVGGIIEAESHENRWLLKIPTTPTSPDGGRIRLVIEPKDDHVPGFYSFTGELKPIQG